MADKINGNGNVKGKRIVKEYFSDARIALMKETKNHPLLVEILMRCPQDWPEQLAEIAAYCNLALDGMYMPMELERLYDILFDTLRKISKVVINNVSTRIN